MVGIHSLEVACPACGVPVTVDLTMRAQRCDCTHGADHAHVIVRHNAEEAIVLHRATDCKEDQR